MITLPTVRHTVATSIRLFLVIGLLLIAWAGLPHASFSAPAATIWYVATTGNDANSCTTVLKPCEHIQAAIDKASSGDTINIAAGTYIEQLSIVDRDLTLKGQSAAATFLDGSALFPILSIVRDNLGSMTINISAVTFQNGKSDQPGGAISNDTNTYLTVSDSNIVNNTASFGGGIFNQGALTLVNVMVRDNNASTTGLSEGGGIWNTGSVDMNGVTFANNQASRGGGISSINTLTLTNSFISDNRAIGQYGGGIYNRSAASRLTLVNSVVSGNQAIGTDGGGIYNDGTFISSGSIISGNLALGSGGGVYNAASGQVTFSKVTFNDNSSLGDGGGFFNNGIAALVKMSVRANQAQLAGGGMYNETQGRLNVETSTVISNTTAGDTGGGIGNLGVLTVTQSALIYNVASVKQGGGLSNAGTAQLTNVTVSDNVATAGGGVHNSGGTLTLQYTTVSTNTSPALNGVGGTVSVGNSILVQLTGNACGGTITSADYNMDQGASCGFSQSHDLSNTDPQIGSLRDNGGDSLTRAIAFTSPAVDSAGTCPPSAVDQRNVARPQGDACDRGAYEVVGYANPNPLDFGTGCVTSTVTINDRFAIGRMLAGVNLTYPKTGIGSRTDLTIRLLSPGTTKVNLLGPAANDGQNLDTLFDDSATTGVPAGNQDYTFPYYDNVYQPATPLLQFRGQGIQGIWKLEICNTSPEATGTLNRWVMIVPEVTDFTAYLPIINRR